MKNLLKSKKVIIGLVVIIVLLLGFFGRNLISNTFFLTEDSITSDVEKDIEAYKKVENENDYLVYFYNKEKCDTCEKYLSTLKEYKKLDGSLPIYKVNLAKLNPASVENTLFMDQTTPYIVRIVGGEEDFRYGGSKFTASELPKSTQK